MLFLGRRFEDIMHANMSTPQMMAYSYAMKEAKEVIERTMDSDRTQAVGYATAVFGASYTGNMEHQGRSDSSDSQADSSSGSSNAWHNGPPPNQHNHHQYQQQQRRRGQQQRTHQGQRQQQQEDQAEDQRPYFQLRRKRNADRIQGRTITVRLAKAPWNANWKDVRGAIDHIFEPKHRQPTRPYYYLEYGEPRVDVATVEAAQHILQTLQDTQARTRAGGNWTIRVRDALRGGEKINLRLQENNMGRQPQEQRQPPRGTGREDEATSRDDAEVEEKENEEANGGRGRGRGRCLLYTSPSPRDRG